MADFIKLRGQDGDYYLNRTLISAFHYSEATKITYIHSAGDDCDSLFEGDITEEILHGEAVGG